MPSPRNSLMPIVENATAGRTELTVQHGLATVHPEAPAHGDAAMYRLSKRLWTLEIHRRLEIQARRAI